VSSAQFRMNRAVTSLAKVGLVLVLLWTAVGRASAAHNVVVQWNEATVDAIRNTKTPPPIASRAFAMMHTAMFDAWAAYDSVALSTRLGGTLRRPEAQRTIPNKEQAISFAAYRVLVDLFPSQTLLFDVLMSSLGYDPSDLSMDTTSPSGVGNISAQALLNYRHFDGSNQLGDLRPGAYSDYTGYEPVNTVDTLNDPNKWQPLVVNGVPQAWLLPQWGLVKPFALSSGSQFRDFMLAQGPALYPDGSYRKQAIAVLHLSAHLNDTAKVIAEYWADGAGTASPPGHWNLIAQEISLRDAHSLDDDVKLFFILGNTLMDAGIAVWDCKRAADSIRPVSAIRFLFGGKPIRAWAGPRMGTQLIDGQQFQSYIPTPPFASYISGHSTFSAASAEILKRFTGSDSFGASFTALSGSSLIEPGLTPAASVTLSWATFSDAADQAGISRRYGGIHFLADDLVGRQTGRLVAAVVWNKVMSYINGTVQ
jgi:membrane-associated phospholipid phosphatase